MAHFEEKTIEKTVDLGLLRKLWKYTTPWIPLLLVCLVLLFISTFADIYRPKIVKNIIDDFLTGQPVGVREAEQGFLVQGKSFVIDRRADQAVLQDQSLIQGGIQTTLNAQELQGLMDYKTEQIIRYALILSALIAFAFLATYGQQILLNQVGERIIYQIRSDLFAKLESLDLRFFEQNPVGRLVTRMTNDLQNINALYTEVIVSFLSDVAIIGGSMVMMILMNWRLALYSFAVIPVMLVVTIIFRREVRKANRLVRIKLAKINATLSENFMGMKTIQIFNQQEKMIELFETTNEEYRSASRKELSIYSVFRPILNLLYYLALILVVVFGGYIALEGALEVGTLVAFTYYLKQLFNPIMELAEKFNIMQAAMSSIERIFLLFDEQEQVVDSERLPVESLKGAVEFKQVFFSYVEGETVLKNISFSVNPGETIAFVGATGSGKSTIINLLTRLYDVDAGEILIDGKNIKRYDKHALRRKISPVLQDVFLFSGDVRSNIKLLSPEITDDKIMQAARFVNADRIIHRFEDQLDHAISEGGSTLSQGERQLLSFARAIVHDPDILILDEATSNIDTETELLIQDAIGKIVRNRTTFVVAHRLSTIKNADRIVVIHKGELSEQGTHDELLAQRGLYYDLYQLQYQEANI